jgi:tetratricopeptide (TPR) repeat protein
MKLAKIALLAVLTTFATWTFGQSLNDAGAAFNEGISLAKEDNSKGAIQAYLNCIEICDQLGEEGNELKGKAYGQVVSIYTNLGLEAYKAKEPNAAIVYLKDALKYSEASEDKAGADNAKKYIGYAYTYQANVKLKEEKYDEAIGDFNTAIEYYPMNIKTYYGLGLAYLKTDDGPKMKEAMDKVIAMGPEDDKTVAKAKSAAGKYYLAKAAKSLEKLQYEESIELLNNSMTYMPDHADSYYYLALAYNNTKAFDKAVATGEQGLGFAGENAFNLHFEIGRAYEGLGETKKACDHYKSVTGGPNVEAAKYQAETVLKCK